MAEPETTDNIRPRFRRALALLMGDRSATTAVEFAMLLPVLTYALFGVVDMSLMMFASEELNLAAGAAVRDLRTGAIQAVAGTATTYAGATYCQGTATVTQASPPPSGENCLGFSTKSTDSASQIFGEALCQNLPVGGSNSSGGNDYFLGCTNFSWDVTAYENFAAFTAGLPSQSNLFNSSGGTTATFNTSSVTSGTGSSATTTTYTVDNPGVVIVAMVGYNYPFFTPLIGCFFDHTDCVSGKQTKVFLSYVAVVEAEPFPAGS